MSRGLCVAGRHQIYLQPRCSILSSPAVSRIYVTDHEASSRQRYTIYMSQYDRKRSADLWLRRLHTPTVLMRLRIYVRSPCTLALPSSITPSLFHSALKTYLFQNRPSR